MIPHPVTFLSVVDIFLTLVADSFTMRALGRVPLHVSSMICDIQQHEHASNVIPYSIEYRRCIISYNVVNKQRRYKC